MDKNISTIDLLESLSVLNESSSERISRTETVFKQICRTCLNEIADESQSNNIFITNDSNGSGVSIKDKLQLLTGMKICTEDRLPNNVCNGCLKSIDSAFSFRVHTQRVDDILKRFIRKIYNSKEETSTGSIQTVGSSEKINDPPAAIEVSGYEVSFVQENTDFECGQCKQIFTSQMDLDKHASKHRRHIEKKSYDCGICSKKFNFRNGLHNHLQMAHKHKKEYKCTVCGKLYTNRDRFRQHTKRPCTALNVALTGTSQITIYPIGQWMTAENIQVEIKNLSCSLCDEKFELEADFASHLQKHSGMKNCPYCKRYVDRVSSLESHVRSHTNERPFVCPLCSKGFLAARSFRNHLKLHTKKESHECATCGNIFSSESELIRHLKHHLQDPVLVPEDEESEENTKPNDSNEGDKFENSLDSKPRSPVDLPITQSLYSQHIKVDIIHKSEMESEDSSKIFALTSAKSEADTAMNLMPSAEEIIIKKEIIEDPGASSDEQMQSASDQAIWNDSTTLGFDVIVKEENSALEIANEPLSEEELPDSLPKQDTMEEKQSLESFENESNKIITGNNGNSDCKTKNEPLFFLKFLDDSKKETEPQCYTSFTCVVEECKMDFKYYRDIVNHYTTQHCQGPSPFKCPVCSESFLLKQNVRTHLKTHLSCEYKCPHCPKGYWQQRDLRTHLRTHTGERPFKCTKCPKWFKQRAALKAHIKTHNLCKEFKCSFCPKEFFSYNGMFLHQKTHKKIKELMCIFCCKQFGSKHRLQRHQSGVCAARNGAEKNVNPVS